MSDCIVVLSGGQDSTTVLYHALDKHKRVKTITFDYGQKHKVEIAAAQRIAHIAGVDNEVIRIPSILKGTSPLVSDNELDSYKDHQSLPGGLEKTFVPCRNLLFLTLAANRAYCDRITDIYTGVCEEDYGGYPDCRRVFIDELEQTLFKGLSSDEYYYRPTIHTPLMNLTKANTVKFALSMPECYTALAYSHTAYSGEYPPETKDHAMLLREKGFEEAGYPDPLIVRAYWENALQKLPKTANYKRFEMVLGGKPKIFPDNEIYLRLYNLELYLRDHHA
jgi:7-cyano-7-deazaguanine synthase